MAKPVAFVIMPYKEPYEGIYKNIIHEVLRQCGFESNRADQIKSSTAIPIDIEKSIRSADLVIGVTTADNLNVQYELGYARALNKEVILLTESIDNVSSDTKYYRYLTYKLDQESELRRSFKEWVEQSRAYQFKSKRQTAKVLNRGEVFSDITDATFFLMNQRSDDKEDIVRRIRNGGLIPPQYIYKSNRGSMLWLDLCQDPEYKYFVDSIEFFHENIDDILHTIGDDIVKNSPDYISLGPGNGAKDKMFLIRLIERQGIRNSEFFYYPFDCSPMLISDTIRNVTRSKTIFDAIKIKAVVCDFSMTLKSFSPVYQYRPEPNIFTLLGNTLGNMDQDGAFLHTVKEAMFPGDILIIEVRSITSQPANIGGSLDTNKKFDFTPLDMLGVEYDEEKLRYSIQPNRSNIPDTRTWIASYHDFSIPGDDNKYESAFLSYVHEYNPSSLEKVIEATGFEILKHYPKEGLCCYILKKV